ncbi:MAG: peptidylprolyl isomerase [Candidatus Dojkabacteria bacterium]|jgi:peptidyl-prolyl cis-trans isomerase B (cyclophilin B)|nr:peptidylprolyl isomerase [Candidatus Dojkabacteria bacterium]
MGVKDSLGSDNGKFLLLAFALLLVSIVIVFVMNSGMYGLSGDLLNGKSTYSEPKDVLEQEYDYSILISTIYGDIQIDLYEELAPNNVNSLLFLMGERYYEGLTIHKVVKDFVIQMGDAKGDGTGDPGYTVEQENLVSFEDFEVGMANSSQFFIVLEGADKSTLDGNYSVVGRVTQGFAVLESIGKVEVNGDYRPLNDIVIKSIQIQEN